jgi:type II secretory pathway pseudopilin PulG
MRRGFSLVEMVVAMTVTMLVFAITLPFVRAQTRSLGSTAGRLDADQVARFAMRAIEQDLHRAAGEYGQPTLVAAGPLLLSFNANIRRADTLDTGALETEVLGYNAGAAWPLSRAVALPTTSRVYPTANFVNADGDTSRTETVTYYLVADTLSAVADTYILYRQFNDQAALELIDGLYLPDSQAFFTYYRNVNNLLAEIPDDSVIFWTAPRMTEIRTVGLQSTGVYVNKFDGTTTLRTIETLVTLPVPLATTVVTCAATPAAPTAGLSVTASTFPRGATLAWNKSAQDTGDPDDALYYILERRRNSGTWSTVGSVNASGSNSYTLLDPLQRLAGTFDYRVSVVGCGNVQSATASLGSLTL